MLVFVIRAFILQLTDLTLRRLVNALDDIQQFFAVCIVAREAGVEAFTAFLQMMLTCTQSGFDRSQLVYTCTSTQSCL